MGSRNRCEKVTAMPSRMVLAAVEMLLMYWERSIAKGSSGSHGDGRRRRRHGAARTEVTLGSPVTEVEPSREATGRSAGTCERCPRRRAELARCRCPGACTAGPEACDERTQQCGKRLASARRRPIRWIGRGLLVTVARAYLTGK